MEIEEDKFFMLKINNFIKDLNNSGGGSVYLKYGVSTPFSIKTKPWYHQNIDWDSMRDIVPVSKNHDVDKVIQYFKDRQCAAKLEELLTNG